MAWDVVVRFLVDLAEGGYNFFNHILPFLEYGFVIGGVEFTVSGILFGGGFVAWVIYKALPIT